jgi:hypothetical protein
MKKFTIVSLIAFLSACSATGPIFSPMSAPRSDQALVYFYRPDVSTMSARTLSVTLDSEPWAELNNNAYVAKYVTPGKHIVAARWTKWLFDDAVLQDPLQVSGVMVAGATYYIRLSSYSTQSFNALTIHWRLSVVPEDEASSEIARTKAQ